MREGKQANTSQQTATRRVTRFRIPRSRTTAVSDPNTSRYARLFQGIYEAVLICGTDGRIIDANARAERLFMATRDDLCGRNIGDFVTGINGDFFTRFKSNLRAGRFTVLQAFCSRLDGSSFPAEAAIGGTRETDDIEEFYFSLRNTTRHRQSQEMLKTQHSALEGSSCGMAIIDLDTVIQYVNPVFANLWNYGAPAKMIGKKMRDIWDRELIDCFKGCLPRRRPWTGEIETTNDSGVVTHIRVTAAPNVAASGKVIGIALSFVNITELREAQEEIRREAEEQLRRARDENDFSGLLNILSIPDVVQLIETYQKSGTLTIVDASLSTLGALSFDAGQIVDAWHEKEVAEKAVYQMIRKKGHSFRFESGEPKKQDHSITAGTKTLLLTAVQLEDEHIAKESAS